MLDAENDEESPKSARAAQANFRSLPIREKDLDRRRRVGRLDFDRGDFDGCHEVEKFAGSVSTIKFVPRPSYRSACGRDLVHIRTEDRDVRGPAARLKADFRPSGTPISITYPSSFPGRRDVTLRQAAPMCFLEDFSRASCCAIRLPRNHPRRRSSAFTSR